MAPITQVLALVASVIALAALTSSSPINPIERRNGTTCEKLLQRRAWHTFSNEEKTTYIKAELCLMSLNATAGLPASRTKFDELQENHQIQAHLVHGVGAFLPYHRLLMWTHEHQLRTLCSYEGAQPYWYEQMDAGHFSNSSLFDPVYGFGGDGRVGDRCITDGPFANYTNVIGPSYNNTKHCIDRRISDAVSILTNQTFVDQCNQFNRFEQAWQCMEGAPHAGGHGGVGGQMLNPISSPGDPLFYLHHTWLDKIWWDWQNLNISSRLFDMGGRNVQDPHEGFPEIPGVDPPLFPPGGIPPSVFPPGVFPPGVRPPRLRLGKRDGDPGNSTTLGHVLNMMNIVGNRTIGEVMDTRAEGGLCYEYVEPGLVVV